MSPDEITGASFETRRRGGLDPDSVRSHLRAAADTVAALLDDRDGLQAELEKAQSSLEDAPEPEVAAPEPLDQEALTEQLGQHAARVLAEAQSAAADRIAEAEAEADEIRAAAEELHAERSRIADARAQEVREEAEEIRATREREASEAAADILAEAERQAGELQTASSVSRQEADHDAERIIRDAEITRRQILEDLARRRTAARRQIEQLRAGRERLLASHETVRRTLDEIGDELTISMSEARAAAETAGHTVSETTIEELEAEIETARLTGLLDTGPLPVVGNTGPIPIVSSTPVNKASTSKAIPTSTKPAEPAAPKLSVARSTSDSVDAVEDEQSDDSVAEETVPVAEETSEVIEDAEDVNKEPTSGTDDLQASNVEPDATDSEAATQGLASVVSLDQARSEVETRTHPAGGRETSGVLAQDEDGDETPVVAAVSSVEVAEEDVAELEVVAEDVAELEVAEEDVAELEVVETNDDEAADSVDSLFASLRDSASVEDPDNSEGTDGSASQDDEAATLTDDAEDTVVENTVVEDAGVLVDAKIDRAAAARRMKRVLADEQSRVMSTLKGGDEVPSMESLLGSVDDHLATYWSSSSEYLGDGSNAPVAMAEFVQQIRYKLTVTIDEVGDADAIVDAMRSIYREFKTSGIDACLDGVLSGSADVAKKPAS